MMSIKVMTQVWAYAKVSGSELLILLAMADFADDHGENVYPSMPTLAQKARLSESQARRVVQHLCELGIVEIVESGGWNGRRNKSNEYRIVLQNEKMQPEGGGVNLLPPSAHATTGGRAHATTGRRAHATTGGRAHATTVVAPMLPDPSVEPPLSDPPFPETERMNEPSAPQVAPAQPTPENSFIHSFQPSRPEAVTVSPVSEPPLKTKPPPKPPAPPVAKPFSMPTFASQEQTESYVLLKDVGLGESDASTLAATHRLEYVERQVFAWKENFRINGNYGDTASLLRRFREDYSAAELTAADRDSDLYRRRHPQYSATNAYADFACDDPNPDDDPLRWRAVANRAKLAAHRGDAT